MRQLRIPALDSPIEVTLEQADLDEPHEPPDEHLKNHQHGHGEHERAHHMIGIGEE